MNKVRPVHDFFSTAAVGDTRTFPASVVVGAKRRKIDRQTLLNARAYAARRHPERRFAITTHRPSPDPATWEYSVCRVPDLSILPMGRPRGATPASEEQARRVRERQYRYRDARDARIVAALRSDAELTPEVVAIRQKVAFALAQTVGTAQQAWELRGDGVPLRYPIPRASLAAIHPAKPERAARAIAATLQQAIGVPVEVAAESISVMGVTRTRYVLTTTD